MNISICVNDKSTLIFTSSIKRHVSERRRWNFVYQALSSKMGYFFFS